MIIRILMTITAMFSMASLAHAQRGPGTSEEARLIRLERAVAQLQSNVSDLHHRVRLLEDELISHPPIPPAEIQHTCMLVESGNSNTFIGKGRSRLDAEAEAQQSCSASTHPSYCSSRGAKIKCDDNLSTRSRSVVCLIVDSGFGKTYRGEGLTAVEAEAKAKISCQKSIHPSYCGNVTPRCEEVL